MPIVGLKIKNKEMSFKQALKYAAEKSYMSKTYLLYLYQSSLTPHDFPSVTSLSNCKRSLWIQKNCDIYADFDAQYAMFQGTMIHSILENVQLGDKYLKEYKMKIKLGDHELSGTCDLYNTKTKQLIDYKTTKSIIFKEVDGKLEPMYLDKQNYINQLHVYALGLEQGGHEVKSMAIEYFPKQGCTIQKRYNNQTFYTDIPAMPYRISIKFDKELQDKLVQEYTKTLDWLSEKNSICPLWSEYYEKGEHKWQCYKLNKAGDIKSSYCVACDVCKKLHDKEKLEMQVFG
jgi:hypothetical protein